MYHMNWDGGSMFLDENMKKVLDFFLKEGAGATTDI